jgi:hypothetical protein
MQGPVLSSIYGSGEVGEVGEGADHEVSAAEAAGPAVEVPAQCGGKAPERDRCAPLHWIN